MTATSTLRPARRAAVFATALAVLLAVAAGCSSSGSSAPSANDAVSKGLSATLKAGSGKIQGTINGAQGVAPGALVGEWKGDLSGSGSVTAQFKRNTTNIPTQLLWVDKVMYINRADVTLEDGDPLAIFTRTTGDKPWRPVNINGSIVDAVPAAFSPASLLQWMNQLKVPVKSAGSEKVQGHSAARYTATRPITVGIWTQATVDFWLDSSNRVVRVRIANPAGGAEYDVTDFGTAVNITKPTANQITPGDRIVAPQRSGAFTVVKSGTTNGVAWKLEKAEGTKGTTCWRWNATPKLAQQTKADTTCLKPPDKDATADDQTQFLVHGNGQNGYDALAVKLPDGVKSMELGYVGGKLESVPVQSSPFVWVGPSSPFPAYLGLTMKNGDIVDCAPGAINTPDDLSDPRLTNAVQTAAWSCLVRAS